MECNKDEARRAMAIAERKLSEKDVNGAKKFALKAESLFPSLEGLSHFMTALNVHMMGAECRAVGGEKDWYGIMSLSPSADESTVKKQYRLLALQLHPDKNRATGAEAAFKLVQEAFNVLKDNNKRNIYDQKRKAQAQVQKASRQVPTPTKPRSARCSKKTAAQPQPVYSKQQQNENSTSCTAQGMAENAARMPFETATRQPVLQPQNGNTTNAAWVGPQPFEPWRKHHMHCGSATPHSSVQDTFWTRCTSCNTWFEYNLIFKNRCLYCGCCRAPFYATTDAGLPLIGYPIQHFQAWMASASASASATPNHASSETHVSPEEGTRPRPSKRMRGDQSTNATGASS